MNTIEDMLRGHFSRQAQDVHPRDWSAEVITRGRRLRTRRRTAIAAAAVVLVIASAWGGWQIPGVGGPRPTAGYVAAGGVPPPVRAAREAAVADYLEKQQQFAWIADSGGRIVCATRELGEQPSSEQVTRVYLWAVCENRGGSVDSGVSLPVAVSVDSGNTPSKLFTPGDGAQHSVDIKANFPRELWDVALFGRVDHERLQRDLDARAKAGN